MTEEAKQETPKQTPAEQIERLLPLARSQVSHVVGAARAYNAAYPVDSTPAEVVDAVTVAVPLCIYMVMAAIMINTLAIHKRDEPKASTQS